MSYQVINTARLWNCTISLLLATGVAAGAKSTQSEVPVWSLTTIGMSSNFVERTPVYIPTIISSGALLNASFDSTTPSSIKLLSGDATKHETNVQLANLSYVSRRVDALPGAGRSGAIISWPMLLLGAGLTFLAWTSKRRRDARLTENHSHPAAKI